MNPAGALVNFHNFVIGFPEKCHSMFISGALKCNLMHSELKFLVKKYFSETEINF